VIAVVGGIVASLLLVAPVGAADPGDDATTAVPIATIGVPQDYDTSGATTDPSDPTSCLTESGELVAGPYGETFWHRFTPATSHELIVDVNSFPDPFAAGYLAVLFLFADDGVGGLEQIGCNAFPATIQFTPEAGRTYYAMSGSFPETPGGGPTVITVAQTFLGGLEVAAAAEYDPQTNGVTIHGIIACESPSDLFVSAFGTQSIGSHQVLGEGGADAIECDGETAWDLTINGFTGPFNPGTIQVFVDAFACNVICMGDTTEALVKAHPVSNKPGPPPPPPPPPPANDERPDAIALEVGGPTLEEDTSSATVNLDTDPQDCPFAGFPPSEHTVWFTVTPAADGWVEINTFGSDFDTTLYVIDGTEVIACNDDTIGVSSRVRFEANAGTEYAVMSGTFADSPGGSLAITALPTDPPPPPPDNDERDGAFPIELDQQVEQDVTGATSNDADPTECPDQFDGPSSATVWYRFTAPSDGLFEVDPTASDYFGPLFVLDGDSVVGCTAGGTVTFEAAAGVDYDLMIGAFSAPGTLRLTVREGQQQPEPLELELTLDPNATVDTRTGAATFTGTVACSREATASVFVFASQEGGRFDPQGGNGSEESSCGPDPTSWSVTVLGETTKFQNGPVFVSVSANAFTDDGVGAEAFIEQDLRLRPAKR
jgi:hypothetical protein